MQKNLLTVYDEWETPMYALRDLLQWEGMQMPHDAVVYEPFVGSGHSTNCLKKLGYNVLTQSANFFQHERPASDVYLITNPPFTIKKECLQRILVEWDVPKFAILLPAPVLQTNYFQDMIKHVASLDVMVPTTRIKFMKNGVMDPKCSGFNVVWVCRGMPIKRPIQMHYLNHEGDKDAF
jgi:hypothetical protein